MKKQKELKVGGFYPFKDKYVSYFHYNPSNKSLMITVEQGLKIETYEISIQEAEREGIINFTPFLKRLEG